MKSNLLQHINNPQDLRKLTKEDLHKVAKELRQFIIEIVATKEGHLGASLGVVELTVALHYIFDTPTDLLVWDVGHQAYGHKILTGRKDIFHTNRRLGGISGFPKRNESDYDAFGVGHSSTSISAALGMAIASNLKGDIKRQHIAVIGDASIASGMAFEALNHAGDIKKDMLIILNDNDMSISKNVGALNNHLAKLLSGSIFTGFRESSKKLLGNIPPIKELASRAEEHLKGMVVPSTFFEELGFNYIGPIDGHDVESLVTTIKNMRSLKGPQFLHVVTTKGKGYQAAEQDPIKYHAVPKFNPEETNLPQSKPSLPTYSKIFGDWLCKTAEIDKKLVAVTPAMAEGSGMVQFSQRFPDQYFDVAIAEQHSVTYAAGLAIGGLKPVVAIYSSFLQRGYDQFIHDVAIQNLPVMFAVDRAGIVGADGATHQGVFDLSFLRCIPNTVIMAPSNERECQLMLNTGFKLNGPSVVRYPRGNGTGEMLPSVDETIELGKGVTIITAQAIESDEPASKSIAILSFGSMLGEAKKAALELNATLVDMRFVKPLDETLIDALNAKHDCLVTVEDNAIAGGAGSGVNEYLLAQGKPVTILNIGVTDHFVKHGTQEEVHHELGLDAEGIVTKIQNFIS